MTRWKFWVKRPVLEIQPTDPATRQAIASLIVKAFGSFLSDERAVNFVTINMASPEWGSFDVTIRRINGKSPAEVLQERDDEIAALRDRIAELS